jgi:hypothetical protein
MSQIPEVSFYEEEMQIEQDRLDYECTRPITTPRRGRGRRAELVTVHVYQTPVRSLPEAILQLNGLRRPDPAGFARRVQALMARQEVQQETPLRPRLQRQNAMPPMTPPPQVQPMEDDEYPVATIRMGAFEFANLIVNAALFEEGIVQPEEIKYKETHNHVLLPFYGPVLPDWICNICFDPEDGDFEEEKMCALVAHPGDCGHAFYWQCPNSALFERPTCPSCRSSGAPLLMIEK